MPEIVSCPQCAKSLRVPDHLLGQQVKCPTCATVFTAAAGGAPPAPRAEPPAPPRRESARRPPDPEVVDDEPEEEPEYEERPRRRGGRRRERAKSRVLAPAIALIITGVLGVLVDLFQIVSVLVMPARAIDPNAPAFLQEFQKGSQGPLAIVMGVLFLLVSVVIILGAVQMLRLSTHGLALGASILAMINFGNCCCLLGLPFGIWSLVVLSNADVKEAFN